MAAVVGAVVMVIEVQGRVVGVLLLQRSLVGC